jgi:hypothetical protein
MTDEIKKAPTRYSEIGVASDYNPSWGIRQDEFLTDLRGERGIQRYREMSSNDAVVGAVLSAMDLMLRSTPLRIEGGTEETRELIDYCLHGMDDKTFEMTLSDILSFLPYGFSLFEIVARPPSKHPKGWVTLKKLAPRAQWTIESFSTDDNGNVLGVWQTATTRSGYIPYQKLLHFRTASRQNDPAGVSVLRNAYLSWYFCRRIQEIEAVAIERELNGLPLVRIPSEYLAPDATDAQRAFVTKISTIARDVKRNEMGFVVLPSDVYEDADGKLTNIRLVDFQLIASEGKRDISTHEVIVRYQQDMARSALADFVTLGTNDRGSFAMAKAKADIFMQALTGYLSAIASVLNRSLIPKILDWNGIPQDDTPTISFGRVAPVDLDQLGFYIQSLTGAGIDLTDGDTRDFIRAAAGFPKVDNEPPAIDPTTTSGQPSAPASANATPDPDTGAEDT